MSNATTAICLAAAGQICGIVTRRHSGKHSKAQ